MTMRPYDQGAGYPDRNLTSGSGQPQWGRRTGPLHPTKANEPPQLDHYSDTPRYDMLTVAEMIGVRAVTLWAWEQNLGLSTRTAATGNGPRYSERDLIAFAWLRDQIVMGADPVMAAQRLRSGNPAHRSENMTSSFSRPIARQGTPSGQINKIGSDQEPVQPQRTYSRPLQRGEGSVSARDLTDLIHPLLQAFATLNTSTATYLLDSAFSRSNIEAVCTSLISPVITRIYETWTHHDIIYPEALFALNMLRSRLYRFYDTILEQPAGQHIFIACGPDEPHELDALILAIFARMEGMRVVFLGQNVNERSLLETLQKFRPAALILSISTANRIRIVTRFAKELARSVSGQIRVGIVGLLFQKHPELQSRVGGDYLGANPSQAIARLKQILPPSPLQTGG